MEEEDTRGKMVANMMVNMIMIGNMAMVYIYGMMEEVVKNFLPISL